MAENSNRFNPVKVLDHLKYDEALQRQSVAGRELDPELALLRTWQSQRLAQTYADLLADERYAAACRFFLTDLYGPYDFTQRDHDAEHLHAVLARILPPVLLDLLSRTIELNRLSNALDRRLIRALFDDLGVTDTITPELYAEGYRICNNYAERARQIELLVHIGKRVDRSARLPLVGVTLRAARGPARRAGWTDLHEFLERGYKAFRQMGGADYFLQTIDQREMGILDRIFARNPRFSQSS